MNPSEELVAKEQREVLDKILNTIDWDNEYGSNSRVKRKDVLIEYFCENKTMSQIGKEHHLSRDRIRQIKEKALRIIRHPSRRKKLEEVFYP